MTRINLIEGTKNYHPRVTVYDNAAHIVTPLLWAGEGQFCPVMSWARITVKRTHGPAYYVVRKVPYWSPRVEN